MADGPIIDAGSHTWMALRALINRRIEELRDQLETVGMDPAQTRGEIAGLRWLKKEVEPDAPITEPTSTDYMQAHAPDPS